MANPFSFLAEANSGQRRTLVASALGWMLDSFDVMLYSLVVAYIIRETRERDATTVEPTEDAQDEWVAVIRSVQPEATSFFERCTPGYYNNEGKGGGGLGGGGYTPGMVH